jgi:hypothetical protein
MIWILAAALSCLTPAGNTLRLGREPTDMLTLQAMTLGSQERLQTEWFVNRNGSGWRRLALESDTALVWPRGQRVIAIMADSSRTVSDMLLAMTPLPAQAPIFLGQWDVILRPDETLYDRTKWGTLAFGLYARFPGIKDRPVRILCERR